MSDEKITYDDVKVYEKLFTMIPSFLLSSMIKRNTNLVRKFKPRVLKFMSTLNEKQKKQLDIILRSDVEDLQNIMKESYTISGKKQYKLLADPKNKNFIKMNLDEIRKLVEK